VTPTETEPTATPPRTRGSLAVKILLGAVCALIVLMWVYAFFLAPKKAVYRVDDDAWRERAEQICRKWEAERLELVDVDEGYIEEPTPEQMLQRADIVEQATDILQAQLDEMTAVQPPTERDRELVAIHRQHWETLIADRRAYIATLRELRVEPYRETALEEGGPVTNAILDFTTVNEIKSCAPPGELGGD
jgi:acetoin utilization deacetylase AcuC-like enzyme